MTMLAPRFEAKVSPEPNSGCWLWAAAIDDKGYGRINVDGDNCYAHRVSYEIHVGPIPKGLELDHLCRNRACVNPAHLEAVTHAENARRSPIIGLAGAALMLTKTHCPQGHPYAGENLHVPPRGGRQCRACGRDSARRHRAQRRAA